MNLLEAYLVLVFIAVSYPVAKAVQSEFFFKYMSREIDRVCHQRNIAYFQDGKPDSIPYPNIEASYKNLNKSLPWNYNFQSFIVYDEVYV